MWFIIIIIAVILSLVIRSNYLEQKEKEWIRERKKRDRDDCERQKNKWAAAERKPQRTALSPGFKAENPYPKSSSYSNKRIDAIKVMDFTAIDFETATYDRKPCQLGLVVVHNGRITEEKQWLIKPPDNKYDWRCIQIHNIHPKDTVHAPEFHELWDEIKPYFDDTVIVSHNRAFDLPVLNKAVEYYNLDPCSISEFYCTKELFCNRSLEDVTTALGIELSNHHDALCDARACAEIYLSFLGGVNPCELNYPQRKSKREQLNNYQKKTKLPGEVKIQDLSIPGSANPCEPNYPPRKSRREELDDYQKKKVSNEVRIQDLSIVENKNTPFYDKKVVISGTFKRFPEREGLALLLKKYGAGINIKVSRQTDYVIIGEDFGPAKMKTITELQEAGEQVKIMKENQLYKILDSIN